MVEGEENLFTAKNPDFQTLLEKITEIHNKKSNDYAEDSDYYSNFKFAAFVADVTVDQVFRVMLGIKLARLKELKKGKTPNFESIEDTIIDLANYACIYASYKGPQHSNLSAFEPDVTRSIKDTFEGFPKDVINQLLNQLVK